MIENCHQGAMAPGLISDGADNHNCTGLGRADGNEAYSDCPFTFWQTTGDPYPYVRKQFAVACDFWVDSDRLLVLIGTGARSCESSTACGSSLTIRVRNGRPYK